MLDSFIYENHLGRRFDGLQNGCYLNYSDLRDYSWEYDTLNNRISRFYRPITDRTLPLVFAGKSDEEATQAKNRLLELAEADVEARIPGRILCGEYYTTGYITASAKSEYLIAKNYLRNELRLTSDDPAWYREETHTFLANTGGAIGVGGGTDYPYDYAYDYAVALTGRTIFCKSSKNNAFKILIHGTAHNPSIVIGGHIYAINGSIGRGESLLIDSLSKKITLTTANGAKINWFDKRGRENYIFEPIPAGQNAVAYSGAFGFDLTIIEQRSEPKWT